MNKKNSEDSTKSHKNNQIKSFQGLKGLNYLLNLFSNPGDLVLDPFSGSASLGEAALLYNRRAILVEKDFEYYSKGIKRLKNVQNLDNLNAFYSRVLCYEMGRMNRSKIYYKRLSHVSYTFTLKV